MADRITSGPFNEICIGPTKTDFLEVETDFLEVETDFSVIHKVVLKSLFFRGAFADEYKLSLSQTSTGL